MLINKKMFERKAQRNDTSTGFAYVAYAYGWAQVKTSF